jgi:hypothetical protein
MRSAITPSEAELRLAFERSDLPGRYTFEAAMALDFLRVSLTHEARALAAARQRRDARQAARAAINYQLHEEDAA